MNRVAGKVALVTGGGSGIGAADCELLAEEGATVIVTDLDHRNAEAVASRIGDCATALHLDVTSEAAWQSVIASIERRFGKLDVLVNNAGVVLYASIFDTTLLQFRLVNSVMSEGVFLGCKYSIPLLRRGGRDRSSTCPPSQATWASRGSSHTPPRRARCAR